MNDDFATPLVIAHLFEACSVVNKLVDHKATISEADFKELAETMRLFAFDLLGLRPTTTLVLRLIVRRLSARLLIWCSTSL